MKTYKPLNINPLLNPPPGLGEEIHKPTSVIQPHAKRRYGILLVVFSLAVLLAACNGSPPEPPRTEAPPLGPAPDPPMEAMAPAEPQQPSDEEEPPWHRQEFFGEHQELRMYVLGAVREYIAEKYPITITDEEVRAALEEQIPHYTEEELAELQESARQRIAAIEAALEGDESSEYYGEGEQYRSSLQLMLSWERQTFPESREKMIENNMEGYQVLMANQRMNEILLGEDAGDVGEDPYQYFELEERRLQIAKQMIEEEHPFLEGFRQEDIDLLIERNRAMRDEWAEWNQSEFGPAPEIPFR